MARHADDRLALVARGYRVLARLLQAIGRVEESDIRALLTRT